MIVGTGLEPVTPQRGGFTFADPGTTIARTPSSHPTLPTTTPDLHPLMSVRADEHAVIENLWISVLGSSATPSQQSDDLNNLEPVVENGQLGGAAHCEHAEVGAAKDSRRNDRGCTDRILERHT